VNGFDYTPDATGAAFMRSRAPVKLICGPVGGGKSTVALMDLVRTAATQYPGPNGVRRTRFLVLRNTIAQLKSTVKPLMDYWLSELPAGRIGGWKHTENIFNMSFGMADGTKVQSEFWLMAADTPDDVRRLLSVECSKAWVEEGREIVPEVFDGLQGRTNRFPNRAMGGVTEPGVIISTNPPPVGSFWHKVMTSPPKGFEIFMQPPALLDDGTLNLAAENLKHLAPDYYENLIAGKSDEWVDVYLKNKFGLGGHGAPVYKGKFNRTFHVSETPLVPIVSTSNPLVVGMDNGLTAAAVLGQLDARSRLNLLDECYVPEGTTMGVERFLDTMLIPRFKQRWGATHDRYVFVLDPACFQRSQVNEVTIAQAVAKRGFKVVKASTNDPERRIGGVETFLGGNIDGVARLRVSPTCTYLIEGFEWGYRYKTQRDGTMTVTPEKTHHSHLHDGLQYLCDFMGGSAGTNQLMRVAPREIQRVAYVY
jgi:hypothetical protein